MAVEQTNFRDDLGILDRGRQQLHFLANMRNFFENTIFAMSLVIQNTTIKLFRSNSRLSKEKVKHTTSASRNQLICEQADNPGAHQ